MSAGERLRTAIRGVYALDEGELVLLDQIVTICDQLAKVNSAVDELDCLTDTGSAGQTVEHALLRTQRDYSALLAKLVESLRLPAPGAGDDSEGESVVTLAARKAARARWDKARADHGA